MQNAEVLLSILSQKSTQSSAYVFDRLYRNLFNLDMYMLAYSNVYAKEGNSARSADTGTIDGFNLTAVQETIALLRQETYYPQPVIRISMPTKAGAFRTPGRPSLPDKLVQEVVRMLLQAIYEPIFKDSSHGFRPNRSCHTALVQVKTTGKGTSWVVEGDIKDFCEQIQFGKLRELLAKKISDGRFLNLIDRFLRAGYMDCQPGAAALTGASQENFQSSSVGPMLANIYLHELDEYMEQICVQFEQDDIKLKYTRYADDFVVMIMGSKQLAQQIQAAIKDFLERELHLELNQEKTLPTHLLSQRVRFLGYEIAKNKGAIQRTENSLEIHKRMLNETIQLLVPADVIREKLKPFVENGKAIQHKARLNLPLLDLIQQYNAEIIRLYQYYCLATDVSTKLGKFKYYHYTSLVKTVARKEKSSVAQVISKYGVDVKRRQATGTRKIVGISYTTPAGMQTLTYFDAPIKRLDQPPHGESHAHSTTLQATHSRTD